MNYIEVTPAYGRDYTSKKAVLADWNAGKDFIVATPGHGTYINKEDAENVGSNLTVMARYKRLTMVARVHGKG